MTTWDSQQQQAKYLEAKLESDVQAYEALTNKFNSWEHVHDRENPYDGRDELDLAARIDRNLNELADCIQKMRLCPSLSSQQEGLIRRYSEINFDLRSEFKRLSQTIQRKKESLELFGSAASSDKSADQSGSGLANSKLLRERSSIQSAQKGIGDMLQQAHSTKETLTGQRSTINSAVSGLASITSAAPSFNRLIDAMQKKKFRDNVILACVVGVMVFFTIWWVFLR